MKGFQMGLLVFFGVFAVLGVLIFSGAIKIGENKNKDGTPIVSGRVIIWGTVSARDISPTLSLFNEQNVNINISYVEKDSRTYEKDLLNSFAFGGGPDVLLLSQDLIYKYEDKIVPIPEISFPRRTFSDTYVRSTEVFLTPLGTLGFPIFSDPLVMYYNQDIFDNAGFSLPPTNWNQFYEYIPTLTSIASGTFNIERSGVALGEYSNVENAKEIISAMILQLNNPIISRIDDRYVSSFGQASSVSKNPVGVSLKFFTDFSNPVNDIYSWNKSMNNSQDEFVSGDLAIYFGKATELREIQKRNPNLNFDVAKIPQIKELNNDVTYTDVYSFAITKVTQNFSASLSAISSLANGPYAQGLVNSGGFAPVRRDLLSIQPPVSKFADVFNKSSLQAKTWIDPDPEATDEIFSKMVEDVLSGLSDIRGSVGDAALALDILTKQ